MNKHCTVLCLTCKTLTENTSDLKKKTSLLKANNDTGVVKWKSYTTINVYAVESHNLVAYINIL